MPRRSTRTAISTRALTRAAASSPSSLKLCFAQANPPAVPPPPPPPPAPPSVPPVPPPPASPAPCAAMGEYALEQTSNCQVHGPGRAALCDAPQRRQLRPVQLARPRVPGELRRGRSHQMRPAAAATASPSPPPTPPPPTPPPPSPPPPSHLRRAGPPSPPPPTPPPPSASPSPPPPTPPSPPPTPPPPPSPPPQYCTTGVSSFDGIYGWVCCSAGCSQCGGPGCGSVSDPSVGRYCCHSHIVDCGGANAAPTCGQPCVGPEDEACLLGFSPPMLPPYAPPPAPPLPPVPPSPPPPSASPSPPPPSASPSPPPPSARLRRRRPCCRRRRRRLRRRLQSTRTTSQILVYRPAPRAARQ